MSNEHLLQLDGGRTLAYEESGEYSNTVFLFFHGAFGVGDASQPSPVLAAKNIRFIAPTLPGWGNSSPLPASKPYHVGLAEDIAALIKHLYPDDSTLRLYISGGSYGTVPAQILYGAPFELFPPGKRIAGCLIISPFSPFRYHTAYTKTMSMQNYMAIGPPAKYIPFNLMQRTAVLAIQGKVKTQASAETFIRGMMFGSMDSEERKAFETWRAKRGTTEGEVVTRMARNVVRSVAKTWDGFIHMANVIHSDWGFQPNTLDAAHNDHPIFIVASTADEIAPDAMAKWLAAKYSNATFKSVVGGHTASLYQLDEIFEEFLGVVQP